MHTKFEKNIPIFCYHNIDTPDKKSKKKGLYVTPEHFEWQVKNLLRQGFEIITFEDIISRGYKKNSPLAILTFDDGCETVFLNAFPILKKYNVKAVVYLITGSIGEKFVVSDVDPYINPVRMLTVAQIKEMADYGIEFGSHLCTHIHLTWHTRERVIHELSSSKEMLENLLKKKIYSVAYPFGDYNITVLQSAQESGYSFGVTAKTNTISMEKKLELGRIPVKGYAFRHHWYFKRKLRFALNHLH